MRVFIAARHALLTLGFVVRCAHAATPLTLHDAVEAAWERLPQLRDIAARRAVASAKFGAGGALFPNAPTATGTFVNDKIAGSNYNYITSQVELSTPVWLPGEGTATQKAADADLQAASADQDALHVAVAEKVLQLAVQAQEARGALANAQQRLTADQGLAHAVRHRFTVGEAPETDALAADAEALSAEMQLGRAQASAATSMAALAALTGRADLPLLAAAPVPVSACRLSGEAAAPTPAEDAALENNPRVVAAERAVVAARAQARLVRIENRDSPEIGLQGINEKQPDSRWDTRVAVVIRVPFASEARNAPRRAAAEQAVTAAEVQLELARREAVSAQCQSGFALESAERSVAAAAGQASALDRRRGKIERAWQAGEMALVEVIRANAVSFDADLARDKAAIDLVAARVQARLALGILP